jgi:predicted outer membrane repeat protein
MRLHLALLASLLTAALATAAPSTVWHVDARAAPGGDGLAWGSAFDTLDAGLAAAQRGDGVWVAAGRYRPTSLQGSSDPRSATFVLPPEVDVYGGFAGHEASVDARAGWFHRTVLDGDLGLPGDPSDNAYHVVTCDNPVPFYHPTSRLDGFRVRGGNADGGRKGGGVVVRGSGGANSWPILELYRCTLEGNRSERGGALAVGDFARVRVLACTFAGNQAETRGGALLCVSGWVWCYDTVWYGNRAGGEGGAIYTQSNPAGSMRFVDNVFYDNSARAGGAAYVAATAFLTGVGKFEGCTAAFNSAHAGGAFYAAPGGKLKVWNSIVWGNQAPLGAQIQGSGSEVSVQHSDVQGGFPGTGNLDLDPRFVDPLRRDLRTLPGSPGRDAGSNDLIAQDSLDLDGDGDLLEPVPLDLDGRRRVTDDPLAPDVGVGRPPVDLGAWEG